LSSSSKAAAQLRRRHHLLDFLDARKHRTERDELRLRHVGDDARQRRLAGAGRSPQDDRLQEVALDCLAQRLAGSKNVVLTDDLIEGTRANPFG